jgi:uncharacterized protein (TIGR02147 family)
MTSEKTPKITSHLSYREYIRERFAYEKRKDSRFSFSYCATKLNTSTPYLKHVMSGKRHIGIDKISKLKDLFGLNSFEARYLLFLFLFETGNDPDLKTYFYDTLRVLRGQESTLAALETLKPQEGSPRRLGNWLPMAIHELPRVSGFKNDSRWISDHLVDKPSEPDVEEALNLLLEDGDLVETEKGLERVEREHTPNPEGFESFQLYKVALTKSAEVIDALPRHKDAQFYSGCLAVDEAGLRRMFDTLDQFAKELRTVSNSCPSPTRVVMLSFNLFNLSD